MVIKIESSKEVCSSISLAIVKLIYSYRTEYRFKTNYGDIKSKAKAPLETILQDWFLSCIVRHLVSQVHYFKLNYSDIQPYGM